MQQIKTESNSTIYTLQKDSVDFDATNKHRVILHRYYSNQFTLYMNEKDT